MTDKQRMYGASPDLIQIDEVTFAMDLTKWTCFCGSRGHGAGDMFEHARVHIDREGEAFLDLRLDGYSIIDPKEIDDGS